MIPIYQPYLSGNEKKYVNDCLDSTWISSRGDYINKFENEFANYLNADYATTVSNGTVALHLALATLQIGSGDEVIVPSFTYVASVNTILQTGAKPIFIDSCLDTLQLDHTQISNKITKNTKAIMAVHLYGQPCAMDEIIDLCEKYNLMLIEDCAEAFASSYHNRYVGTFGDAATFSFFGNKTITTGEGGMVIFKDHKNYEIACHLKNQGVSTTKQYWHDQLAYNYRMTNICAAIGLAQLEKVDEILEKKRNIAKFYQKNLKDLPLRLHVEQKDCVHTFWMNSIILNNSDHRDVLQSYLKEAGIDTRPLFPPVNTMPHCFTDEYFPNAEIMSASGLNLPSYPALKVEQLAKICDSIRQYFSNC